MAFPRAKKPLPFPEAEIVTDPVESAKAAGLRYVYDTRPGIRRRRYGKGFRYIGLDGSVIKDVEVLRRIRSLVIPPAWTDVWICNNRQRPPAGDGPRRAGRKQSRYHPRWREVRDETKYERMLLVRRSAAQDSRAGRGGPGAARVAARKGARYRGAAARDHPHPRRQRGVRPRPTTPTA